MSVVFWGLSVLNAETDTIIQCFEARKNFLEFSLLAMAKCPFLLIPKEVDACEKGQITLESVRTAWMTQAQAMLNEIHENIAQKVPDYKIDGSGAATIFSIAAKVGMRAKFSDLPDTDQVVIVKQQYELDKSAPENLLLPTLLHNLERHYRITPEDAKSIEKIVLETKELKAIRLQAPEPVIKAPEELAEIKQAYEALKPTQQSLKQVLKKAEYETIIRYLHFVHNMPLDDIHDGAIRALIIDTPGKDWAPEYALDRGVGSLPNLTDRKTWIAEIKAGLTP